MAALAAPLVAVGAGNSGGGGTHDLLFAAWKTHGIQSAAAGVVWGNPCSASCSSTMNRRRLAVLWLLSSAALAALTAWGVLRWHVKHEHPRSAGLSATDSEERFHDWVHEHLHITPAQDAALHSTEQAFADRRRSLRATLHTANEALRAAILRDRSDSAAVQQAVQSLASAQAALQQATLGHLFEMADKLDPPQREKLLQWLHDSLQPPP